MEVDLGGGELFQPLRMPYFMTIFNVIALGICPILHVYLKIC